MFGKRFGVCKMSERQARDRAYYLANRETIRAKKKAYYQRVREHVKQKSAAWRKSCREADPVRWREHKRKSSRSYLYRLSETDLAILLRRQGGTCALCPKTLNGDGKTDVDHDHTSGVVRGLLCRKCNIRLSAIEDTSFLTRAQEYLARTPKVPR